MEYKEILLIFTSILAFISVIGLLMIILMRIMVKNRLAENYNYEKNHALIEAQRSFYEKQIYELTKRLSLDSDRWLDLNQMLLSAQENINKTKNNKIMLNTFLKNCGITEEDLVIDQKLVFTIIPLNDSFSSLFKNIKTICSQNNLEVIKSDEQYIDGAILNHIVKLIVRSRFLIAVLDGRNANVYYELGIAHSLGKDVILLSAADEYIDMPFDIKSKDIAFYNSPKTLSLELNDRIKKMLIQT
jgi:hypothetical protein